MQEITEHIKKQLESHTISPPENAWNTISQRINKEEKKQLPWLKWAAAVACLILPIFSTVLLWKSPKSEIIADQTPTSKKNEKKNNLPQSLATNVITKKAQQKRSFSSKNSEKKVNKSISCKINNKTCPFLKGKTSLQKKEKTKLQDSIKPKIIPQKKEQSYTKELFQEEQYELSNALKPRQRIKIVVSPYTGLSSIPPFNESNLITTAMNSFTASNKYAMTYGSKASIAIGERLRIRSGVGIINLKQETYNVPLTTLTAEAKNNFNMLPKANLRANILENGPPKDGDLKHEIPGTRTLCQTLSYELQFIEIPLEIEYNIFKKRNFDIAATSGLSTLLRNKNIIYIDGRHEFAESTNIKKVSLATNIGIKFNYYINPKLSLNIEPQMKYLLNTVSENNELKPYTLGINIGFSWDLFSQP